MPERLNAEKVLSVLAKGLGYDIKKHRVEAKVEEIDLSEYDKMNVEELNAELEKLERLESELKARDDELRRTLGLFIQGENPPEFKPIFEGDKVIQDRVSLKDDKRGKIERTKTALKNKIDSIKRNKIISKFEGANPSFKGIIESLELEAGTRSILWVNIKEKEKEKPEKTSK